MNLTAFALYGTDIQNEINAELENILTTSVMSLFANRSAGATIENIENEIFNFEMELNLKVSILYAINEYNLTADIDHKVLVSFDTIEFIDDKESLKIIVRYIPLGVLNVSSV